MARVKVTINKKGNIPSLGLGPIRRPILITEELCNQLIALGYPVKIISSPIKTTVKKEAPVVKVPEEVVTELEKVAETNEEEVLVDPANEEVTVEESIEGSDEGESVIEEEEKVITEEEDEEVNVVINDPDLSAEAYYTEDFLSSKKLCKKILSNRTIQYDDSASWGLLKKLVLESNPDVELPSEEETVEE